MNCRYNALTWKQRELDLRQQQRKLQDDRERLELDVARKPAAEREKITAVAKKQAYEQAEQQHAGHAQELQATVEAKTGTRRPGQIPCKIF